MATRQHRSRTDASCVGCEPQSAESLPSEGGTKVAAHSRSDGAVSIAGAWPNHAARPGPGTGEVIGAPAGVHDEPQARRTGVSGMLGSGILAGLVTSLCCLPAAVAFALGLSGSSVIVGLGLYRPYFTVAGVALAVVAIWWSLRRSRRCCSAAAYRRNQFIIPVVTMGTFLASYALIRLVLLPWLYRSP